MMKLPVSSSNYFVSCFSFVVAALLFGKAFGNSGTAEREVQISIQNHVFTPSLIEAVEGETLVLKIKNNDAQMEEFESKALSVEKLIGGKKSATIYVGPLKKGEYDYFGEFHLKTAQGKIVVKGN
jgi:plastocyanin